MEALPGKSEGVIYLEGLFFLNQQLLKSNALIVQNSLKEIYSIITDN